MKTRRKRIVTLLSALLMVLLFSNLAHAASCTCQESNKPHDSSHQTMYVSNGSSGHAAYCLTCITNGHSTDCAQVLLSQNDPHVLSYSGSGTNRVVSCSYCDYEEACSHSNATWQERYNTVGGTGTNESTCVKYCDDCKQIIQTKNHNWAYKQYPADSNYYQTRHIMYCADCSYISTDSCGHTWKYLSYKKPGIPRDPVTYIAADTSAAQHHTAYVQCTACGYKTTILDNHTFKNKKCTKCGLKNESSLKVTKLKKKKVKSSHKVTKYSASYVWNGIGWSYRKGGTGHNYTYKITVSWKKTSKAYGYYCVIGKPNSDLKTGAYLTDRYMPSGGKWNASGGYFVPTKKTSATLSMSAGAKVSKVDIYVAPVSKYGFIGKWQKLTVKMT